MVRDPSPLVFGTIANDWQALISSDDTEERESEPFVRRIFLGWPCPRTMCHWQEASEDDCRLSTGQHSAQCASPTHARVSNSQFSARPQRRSVLAPESQMRGTIVMRLCGENAGKPEQTRTYLLRVGVQQQRCSWTANVSSADSATASGRG